MGSRQRALKVDGLNAKLFFLIRFRPQIHPNSLMQGQTHSPKVFDALIPLVFLIVLLVINIQVFGTDGLSGSSQIVLILSAFVAALVAIFRLGFTWETLQDGVVKSISAAMPSILILFLIGALAGTWLLSGIVPAMIYYGLQILSPEIFLVAACVVCAVVSVATGSSWTTVATVGVALLGIGKA